MKILRLLALLSTTLFLQVAIAKPSLPLLYEVNLNDRADDQFKVTLHVNGLTAQDVEIGYPDFDDQFIIQGNNEYKLQLLFTNINIRQVIEAQPEISLEVKDDEGWLTHRFPEGVDLVSFQVVGVIKDVERLTYLYGLFAEVLNQLCRIGSAYEDDPNVIVS